MTERRRSRTADNFKFFFGGKFRTTMKTYNLRKKTTDIGRSAAKICSARIMSACFRARVNHAKAKNPTISGSRTSQSWKRCAPVPSSSFLTIPKKVMYITRYAKNTSGITIGIQALGFLIRELIVMGVLLLNVSIYMYLLNLLGKGYLSMVCMIKNFSFLLSKSPIRFCPENSVQTGRRAKRGEPSKLAISSMAHFNRRR